MITKYRLLIQVAALVAILAAAGYAVWWIVSPRIEVERAIAERALEDLANERDLSRMQAIVLEGQQEQISAILEIDRRFKELGQIVQTNAKNQNRALEELKQNDQTISAYLSGAVPTGIGLLYSRPNTTDPGAYKTNTEVQSGAMQSTGAPSIDQE